MKRAGKIAIGVALTTAVAVFGALQTVSAPANEVGTSPPASETPTATPQGPCGFMWASKDAPELTVSFDNAVKALNSEATGRAELFGEDCVYADGSSTFGVMETDFYVRLPVSDLGKEEEFGNWVAQVMQIVTQIPRETLPGNYGFVEFTFAKNSAERIIFRVPIQQYISDAQEKSGAELFRQFYSPP
ncbi:MAG: hypothetical protein J0M11_18815 [Anaerolineae bacterium]|nr:hypothetical protein [Anaerolineae bacterium]